MFRKKILFIIFIISFGFGYSQTQIDSLKTVLASTTDSIPQLQVLDELTKVLVRENHNEQELYLRQYVKLSKALKEYDLMAAKSRFLLWFYANQSQQYKSLALADSLLGFKKYFKKESSEAHILLKRAAIHYDLGNFKKAIEDYNIAAQLFMKSGDSIFAADAYLYGGQVNADSNNFLTALDHFKSASKLYELLGDTNYAVVAASNVSLLYTRNGLLEKGIAERERLLKQTLAKKDYGGYMDVAFQNASSYFKLQQYHKQKEVIDTMDYYMDSLKIQGYSGFHDFGMVFQKATYYTQINELDKAKTYVSLLDEKASATRSPQYTEEAVLYAKALYFDAKDDTKSLQPILERITQRKSTSQIHALLFAQNRLAVLYEKAGNYKAANQLRKANLALNDSIFNSQRTNTFLYYQSEFEAEKKERALIAQEAKIQQLETEQKLARTKRNTLITSIVLFFIVAITFFTLRNRQKIREQAYQNILLNNKVASKTEEINELLAETVQHIKSKEQIAKNLQKVVAKNGNVNIKSIIADLNAKKSDDSKLLLIKENIEKVNFEFIKKLGNKFPDLTKTDVEICSFLRIGLDRNQIAQLRNTTIEAVRKSRHRIRKKMYLDDSINLEEYLSTL